MTTDTKLRLHDISSKGSLCYGGQTWIISNTGTEKLEAVQITLLRPLLGLTPQDRQRKLDIRNRLKVDKIIEDKDCSYVQQKLSNVSLTVPINAPILMPKTVKIALSPQKTYTKQKAILLFTHT
jgi:hypothetical protein